jgi:hypothetical protein
MAVDKTEPPIKVIITVAGLSIGILVAMRVFFVSYFHNAYDARSREHIDAILHGGSYIWTSGRVRSEEQHRLTRLPNAIAAVSAGLRPESIRPTSSVDLAPLQGWTLAPREVPRPAPAVVEAASPTALAGSPAVAAPAALAAAGAH